MKFLSSWSVKGTSYYEASGLAVAFSFVTIYLQSDSRLLGGAYVIR